MRDLSSGALTSGVPPAYALLLQEALEGSTLDRLAGRNLSTFFAPVREVKRGTLGNAIVSTLPLEDPRAIALPRERQRRTAAIATVRVSGEAMFIVSVHLENRGAWWQFGPLDEAARGRQAQALVDALPASAHGIVGGDLNTWLGPAEPAWRTLLARFPDTPARTRFDTTFRDRSVLDHLFFDVADGWTVTREVLSDAYGSDHRPVLGQLFLDPTRADTPFRPD